MARSVATDTLLCDSMAALGASCPVPTSDVTTGLFDLRRKGRSKSEGSPDHMRNIRVIACTIGADRGRTAPLLSHYCYTTAASSGVGFWSATSRDQEPTLVEVFWFRSWAAVGQHGSGAHTSHADIDTWRAESPRHKARHKPLTDRQRPRILLARRRATPRPSPPFFFPSILPLALSPALVARLPASLPPCSPTGSTLPMTPWRRTRGCQP